MYSAGGQVKTTQVLIAVSLPHVKRVVRLSQLFVAGKPLPGVP